MSMGFSLQAEVSTIVQDIPCQKDNSFREFFTISGCFSCRLKQTEMVKSPKGLNISFQCIWAHNVIHE